MNAVTTNQTETLLGAARRMKMESATAVSTQRALLDVADKIYVQPMAEPPPPSVEPAAVAPVTGRERLVALDTLRGVAVLGILLMNILFFGMPMVAGFNPDAAGEATFLNRATWVINQILFEGKM